MPRLPRLHVPGGYYHVMLRGNHREALFAEPADRVILNDIVGEVMERVGARVHAYCWMTNHIHVLMQIADRPLGEFVQRVAMRYSRFRHRQMATTGHLFERRYRAKLVEMDAYLFALLRYIHLNPVAAGIVSDPADYPWSSHLAYLGRESMAWLTTDIGLGLFGSTVEQARTAYANWMAQKIYASEQNLLDDTHPNDSRVLGGDRFLATLPPIKIQPRSLLTLDQLANQICSAHRVAIDIVRSPHRQRTLTAVRVEIASRALAGRIATIRQVAEYFGRDPSGLSALLTRYRKE